MKASTIFKNFVIPRIDELRKEGKDPKIVVKLDVEGADLLVMKDLVLNGCLGYITFIYGEHLQEPFRSALTSVTRAIDHVFDVQHLDDETFYTSDFPLPK